VVTLLDRIGERIGRRIRQGRAKPLPFALTMDVDEQGQQVVGVYGDLPGGRERLDDLPALSTYGYVIERDGQRFTSSVGSLERLLAVSSLNPQRREDGDLVFPVDPPVLSYLRRQPMAEERDASKRLKVSTEPIKPIFRIAFDAATGATVQAGYETETGELVASSDLHRTPDGGYVRVGDVFSPLPDPSPEVERFLTAGTIRIPLRDVPEFFARDLDALRIATRTDLTPAAAAVQIIEELPPPRFKLDADTPGWLDFDVSYGQAGSTASLRQAAEAARRGETYVQVGTSTFVRIDKSSVLETELLVEQLNTEPVDGGYRVPAERIGQLQDLATRVGGGQDVSVAFQRFLDDLTGLELDPAAPLPPVIEQTLVGQGFELRPYQRQGIQWLRWLATNGLHGLLADDMGLGKTAQTILAIRANYIERPQDPPHTLIVCPTSVVRNWEREIRRLFPGITIDIHLGTGRQMSDFQRKGPRIFISTYGTMLRDAERLQHVGFRYLVLDEASQIKNPSVGRTKAMKRIIAIHRICLTGTPIENRPAELWSLMDFLLPGHLGVYGTFVRQVEGPIMAGDSEASRRLTQRISPFLLRRLKEDVAKDLPDKVDLKAWCSLTAEQTSLYRQFLNEADDEEGEERRDRMPMTNILTLLTRLQQVCDHPAIFEAPGSTALDRRSEKFDLVLERITEVDELDEKVIVFSHFLRMLDLLGTALDQRGIRFVRIDGSMPVDARQNLVDRVTNEPGLTVALCSLHATSFGINLQAANHVIHVDRWWNPAIEDQATARAHRIGQTKTVFVHRVLVKGTLEERIDWLLEKKRGIADDVIGGASGLPAALTREELLDVLRPLDDQSGAILPVGSR